ncbi:holin [Paenibacillus sp. strain BS8-2]
MTKTWMKAATVRGVKTAAQTAIASIGATTVFSQVDWRIVGGTVLLATITSFLTSLAGLPEVTYDDRS